jgi:hypothetical protein
MCRRSEAQDVRERLGSKGKDNVGTNALGRPLQKIMYVAAQP